MAVKSPFKPYAGVSTAILLFTKTDSGGTDQVWFYDLRADGYSLDDKRTAPMTIQMLGKNGDQIERLGRTAAQVLVVQHCHAIRPEVHSFLRTTASDSTKPSP